MPTLPDEEVPDDDEIGADEGDAGASEGDDEESDGTGDEADAQDSDSDADADDGEEDSGDVDPSAAEKPRRQTANEVIRKQKSNRKASDRRAQEAERKAEEAERKAGEALQRAEAAERRANERQQRESAQEEAQRLELMSESEKIAHYRQKDKEENQREMNGLKFQMWDSTDRSEFRQLKREDPLVAQVADQVEAEFERLRSQNRPVSRELLANQFIAKKMRESQGKARSTVRARTKERTRRETVQPRRVRSDVTADRRRTEREDTPAARRKRLEDVQL